MRARGHVTVSAITVAFCCGAVVAALYLNSRHAESSLAAEPVDPLSPIPGPMYEVHREREGFSTAGTVDSPGAGEIERIEIDIVGYARRQKLEFGGAGPDSVPNPVEIAIAPIDANEPSCVLGMVVPQGGPTQDPYLLVVRGPIELQGERGIRGPCRSIFGVLTVDRELEDLYPEIFHDLPYCRITGGTPSSYSCEP